MSIQKTKVRLGKVSLPLPIVCASGTFGFGEEVKSLVDFSRIGAVVTKTITLTPRAGNPPPRIFETACGVLNSVGLENPGVDVFLKEKLPALSRLGVAFIVSVGGSSGEEYEELFKRIEPFRQIRAMEINLSCPNLKLKKMVSQDKAATYRLLKRLRRLTKKTLIAKITPEVTDIVEIARAVKQADIDAVSLVNTFYGLALDIETLKPRLGNVYGGYSGRAIKPLSLYRVWQVSRHLDIPLVGGGGIETPADAIEFFLAGATVVSLGTVNMAYPNQASRIAKGIEDYLCRKKIPDIKILRARYG
jgi:dihydroorotate dehydrogenase (NAD+) catalytic subunit